MCGIIGYAGNGRDREVLDVLLTGLSGLEYRGYDSAGIALADEAISVYKSEGELEELEAVLDGQDVPTVPVGIGHTRWSTHGPPSDRNAHPHADCDSQVAIVHNGIIENYEPLREELAADGHTFYSETDTEVVPHLIERYLDEGLDHESAFRTAVSRLEGSYALAAVFEGSETIYATRQDSPLVLGLSEEGTYLASDVPAFIQYTDQVIYLEDGQFAALRDDDIVVTDAEGRVVEPPVETIEWDAEDAGKSGYDHYMLKEINEQPRSLRQCLRGRVDELEGSVTIEELDGLATPERVQFVACGTSYHAALYGELTLRERGVQAQTFMASEYDRSSVPIDDDTLVIGVTQSGETADTLRALRQAGRAGATTLAVTNVVGSSAARECDYTMYIRAGPEIGVAATKTFASQQTALTLLADVIEDGERRDLLGALRDLPDDVQAILDNSGARKIAAEYEDAGAYFFIGRGYNYPVALEGALKMKEITYKHAEGFAAGELKHGPLALVTGETPIFAVVTGDDERATKTIGNVKEVEARGAPVIAVTDGQSDVERYADHVLSIPRTHGRVGPILANVQLQLVSYWLANRLDRSIDKPRNLAKSVTVE
ncbi:glutamine--fructose-6-phosphate transaminase (isomerizing) [Halalkalicoccus sp. NIPERK01]|uniref:glutamine--fructose-6-phosphate transaminase (isomerizing) n=1 Tax=Halalkalicoccus sp. NIPERK01 TaxID=3053469 RepID=UPI00256F3273|nr:glutamine--fructose-6-phosphate transaminase (isomerizing) [Halalkalicoccus sp. NIPERK01]MDL5362182.1 glutamine--fructose-6-phosphate transaminase (isomerizing) [Halalkalicoccus sp. NIPERK01]